MVRKIGVKKEVDLMRRGLEKRMESLGMFVRRWKFGR
jgi:hypothetical protein